MAQLFVKTATGLQEVGRSKIRNYADAAAVECAIRSGELQEGDLFTTVAVHGITEDIQAVINCLVSITPQNAAPDNMLVTQDQLDSSGSTTEAAIECVQCQVTDIATDIVQKAYCNDLNALAARVGVNETNISSLTSNKVSCSDYATRVSEVDDALDCKVDCSDYTTRNTDVDDALSCKVECSDYTTCVTALDTAIQTKTSCVGTVTCFRDSRTGIVYAPNANGQLSVPIPQSATYSLTGNVLNITF